jgi:hypothetical protein
LGAGAITFHFTSDAEGWTASGAGTGVASFGAAGGLIFVDFGTPTGGFDPMLMSPTLSVMASRDHYLVLRINLTAAPAAGPQTFQMFFENEFGGYSEPRSRTFAVTPNTGWQTITVDLLPQGGRDPWQGTVTHIRLDPGTSAADQVGYRCEIDRLALISDSDNDGISDDIEILYWGNLTAADNTTDHDNNGMSDATEILFGMDPTVDLGESLPAASPWALLATVLCLLALGFTAIRVARCTQSPDLPL